VARERARASARDRARDRPHADEALGPEDFEEKIRATRVAAAPEINVGLGQMTMDELEQRSIREMLRFAKDDKTLAALLLGISVRTIYRKLDEAEKE